MNKPPKPPAPKGYFAFTAYHFQVDWPFHQEHFINPLIAQVKFHGLKACSELLTALLHAIWFVVELVFFVVHVVLGLLSYLLMVLYTVCIYVVPAVVIGYIIYSILKFV